MTEVPKSLKGKKSGPRFDFSWMGSIAARIRSALSQKTVEETREIERQSEIAWRESIHRLSRSASQPSSGENIPNDNSLSGFFPPSDSENDVQGDDEILNKASGNSIGKETDEISSRSEEEDQLERKEHLTQSGSDEDLDALYDAEVDDEDLDADLDNDVDFDDLENPASDEVDGVDEIATSGDADESNYIDNLDADVDVDADADVDVDADADVDIDEDGDINDGNVDADESIGIDAHVDEADEAAVAAYTDLSSRMDGDEVRRNKQTDVETLVEINSHSDNEADVNDEFVDTAYVDGAPDHEADLNSPYSLREDDMEVDESATSIQLREPEMEARDEIETEVYSEYTSEHGTDDPEAVRSNSDTSLTPVELSDHPVVEFSSEASADDSHNVDEEISLGENLGVENHMAVPNRVEPSDFAISEKTSKYVGFLFGPSQNDSSDGEVRTEKITEEPSKPIEHPDPLESRKPTKETPQLTLDKQVEHPNPHNTKWNLFNVGFSVAPSSDTTLDASNALAYNHFQSQLYTPPSVIASTETLRYAPPIDDITPKFLPDAADEEFNILTQTAHRLLSGSALFGGLAPPVMVPPASDIKPTHPPEDPEESLRRNVGAAHVLFAGSSLFGGKRKREPAEEEHVSQKVLKTAPTDDIKKPQCNVKNSENHPDISRSDTKLATQQIITSEVQKMEYLSEGEASGDHPANETNGRLPEDIQTDSRSRPPSRARSTAPRSIPTRHRPMTRTALRALEAERKQAEEKTQKDSDQFSDKESPQEEVDEPPRKRRLRRRK